MKKKLISAILCISSVLSLSALPVVASTGGTCGDKASWTLEGDTITIYGSGAMYAYQYTNNSSTNSTHPWSGYGSSIKKANINKKITYVGNYSFYNCSALSTVSLADSVTSIGCYAFCGTSLANVTIPNSVTSIGEYAFRDCTSLTNVTIPNTVTSLGENIFYGCENLNSAVISEGIISIPAATFKSCNKLTEITIPSTLTDVGAYAFDLANSEKIKVNISDLSAWCDINFHSTYGYPLTYNGGSLYLNGEEITELVIPSDVTNIKQYTFKANKGVTSVAIPKSVTSIGANAFDGCSNLTTVYYEGTEDEWYDNITFSYGNTALLNADFYFESYPTADPTYEITASSAENGTISADKQTASKGETVTLTVIPSTGYQIKAVKYNDTAISPVEGVYSFIMPEGAVTITAEFEQIPVEKQAVSITDTDARIVGSVGDLRFITDVTNTDGLEVEYFGTWMIPQALFAKYLTELKAEVIKNENLTGNQYTADLLNIPSDYFGTKFIGISFVKFRGVDNLVLGTKVTSVNESYIGE